MKKRVLFSILVLIFLVTAIAGCGGQTAEAPKKFINLATGGTAGTYFPLGGAMAEIWNNNITGVNATAQATGASVANVNLLKDGNADIIFVQNDIAFYAANGQEMFKDKQYTEMRALATIYPETVQIVTLEDKKINTVADLKGKRIAVGAAGSGVEANARQVMAAAGITYDDIDEKYLSFAEAAAGLKDNNIDVAFLTAGFPTAAIQDVGAQRKLKIIPIDDTLANKLIQQYPFYTPIVIPANTYTNQTSDVKTLAVKAMLAVSSKMDETMAYDLVKTMYENGERLKAAHALGGMIVPASGKEGVSIKFHPGAEKYFNEVK